MVRELEDDRVELQSVAVSEPRIGVGCIAILRVSQPNESGL
jgi:hypothetical protein